MSEIRYLEDPDIMAAEAVKKALLSDPNATLSTLIIQTRREARKQLLDSMLWEISDRYDGWDKPHVGDERFRSAGRQALSGLFHHFWRHPKADELVLGEKLIDPGKHYMHGLFY